MIDRMLYLRPALERLIRSEDKLGPSGFFLTSNNWVLLEKLQEILGIFVVATTRLSATQYPTLHMQLPYYTILLRDLYVFKEEELDTGIPALASACAESYDLLNRYWTKTDEHSCQVIAMILDPRFKLKTFTHIGWEDEWIEIAKRKFLRIYNRYYAPPLFTDTDFTQSPAVSYHPSLNIDSFDEIIFGGATDTSYQQLNSQQKSQAENYLDEIIANRTVPPIDWWKSNSYRFPDLARMARDYIAIPASSVPSEQLFSRASDIITKKRNRLLDASSSSLLLVKSWLGWPEVEKWEVEAEREIEYEDIFCNENIDIDL